MGTKIISNGKIGFLGGLAGNFPADWLKPSLAEMQALSNVSEATRFNSFGIGVQASQQTDDRALSDAAGSQERGYAQFGGDAQFYQPTPTDTTSSYAVAKGIFGAPNTQVIAAMRLVDDSTKTVAAGDEFDFIMHGLTDAQRFARDNQPGIYYQATLLSQSDLLVNYIVPDGTTKVLATANDLAPAVGELVFFKATYFGIDITKQAEWVSADPAKLQIIAPGVGLALVSGAAGVTAMFPNNAATASTSVAVVVA